MADLTGMMQAAAGGAGGGANYIEDVFSTYLYTGTGAAQTITNEIDLAGEGGLTWIKSRSAATSNFLFDTERGVTDEINSDSTDAEASLANSLTAFNSNGFSISSATGIGVSAATYVSWTFRKQPKFFDVVTYTGNGGTQRISHSLGSVPGCIIAKATSTSEDWCVWHRGAGISSSTYGISLNKTNAAISTTVDATASVNSATFNPNIAVNSPDGIAANSFGVTYVAYIFAHDAGGFGLTGEDNVVSCGSYAGSASTVSVSLGYEPQWVMIKPSSTASGWTMVDNMRGMPVGGENARLYADANYSESAGVIGPVSPTATGFTVASTDGGWNAAGETYIYIAIRRGPMAVPELGTSVFYPTLYAGNGAATQTITGASFAPDLSLLFDRNRDGLTYTPWTDRLRGGKNYLESNNTNSETTASANGVQTLNMDGVTIAAGNSWNSSTYVLDGLTYLFGRAPGFFDEVCYTGTGSATTFSHNLGAVPELMIVKKRSATDDWAVYAGDNTDFLQLNTTAATADDNTYWNDTSPTSTVFSVGTNADVNTSAATYVAYLFATLAGVSKVGSYTGTAAAQVINCGFTTGARFVLIKRTDSTGGWHVWDSARGIIAGDDPYLLLNSTAAEVTNTDYVDTAATGFELTSTAPAAINASGGSYIFLAIS